GYRSAVNITPVTRRLLEHWTNPERERKLFSWHSLNKIANPQRREFSDAFLVVAPGITIRDRLRVLLQNDPENYYKKLDLVPSDLLPELEKAKIVVTNYHAFKLKEHTNAASLTKSILIQGKESIFTETPSQMVNRVCRGLGTKKNIIVINDEAHHCYRRRVGGDEEKYKGDDLKEAKKNEEEARVWISGLEAIQQKLGVKLVYDLSATPFFLKGSGYKEGTLFPWVVSDFSLIDAIESGIVKIPRMPVSDDSMKGEMPTYRNIWMLIRDHLPKKGRGAKDSAPSTPEPKLPKELEGALLTLYGNYEKAYRAWEQNAEAQAKGLTPPVFIVVCNNTSVSKMVYDYICGWDTGKTYPDSRPVLAPGQLPVFSNVKDGNWIARPNTILVDSEQLESGESLTAEFKQLAAREIEESNDQGMFEPEYAEVYGIPFAFIPCAGSNKAPKPGLLPTRVRSLPERIDCEITFPKLLGYRYEISSKKLTPDFSKPGCRYSLSTADLPTVTVNAPIIGLSS
ncbi:MAG: restriction endonuclease, partial [Brasilonema sp.]